MKHEQQPGTENVARLLPPMDEFGFVAKGVIKDFAGYFRFLEDYWTVYDWQEAVKRSWRPGCFHDIRL